MFGSDVRHGPLSGEADNKHPQVRADKALAHSLASIPAGLEAVTTHHTHFQQAEKETAQALPEAISQDGKEAMSIVAPPHNDIAFPGAPRAERRACGLKRRIFWSMCASLVLALALIVGLASGLGVSRSRGSSNCDSCMHSWLGY